MTIDRQLYDFFPHTVTITPKAGVNDYGETTYSGGSRTAPAYVEPRFTLSATDQIDELHQPTRAYIADTTLTYEDQIEFPDGTTPDIATVETHDEVVGLEHTVVTFL
jgi:hypothetical protein